MQGKLILKWQFIPAITMCLLLNGCFFYKKAPDTQQITAMAMPKNTQIPANYLAHANSSNVINGWLSDFKDPVLSQLVNEAIQNNPDLVVAAANVDIANANARKAAANLYPSVLSYGRLSFKNGIDSSMTVGLSGVGFFFGWTLDLWGQIRSQAAAGELNYQAAQADYQFVEESLAAQVAKTWFTGNLAATQLSLAQQAVQNYKKLLVLVKQQENIGQVSEINVESIQTGLSTAENNLIQAQNAQSDAARSLQILIGHYPNGALIFKSHLAYLPAPPPVGIPSQLLQRRWDIIAAENRVASSFHNVHAQEAALLPQVNLSAGFGVIDGALSSFTGNNHFYNYGGNLLWPIFTGGALEANIEIAEGERKRALADFAHTAMMAFMQVETALSNEQNLIAQNNTVGLALTANQKNLQLMKIRYRVGQIAESDVLQQQITVIQNQSDLATIQSQLLLNRIDLYLALGGGFSAH